MTLAIFTRPTSEPVTLAEARAQLRLTDNSEDVLVAGYLLAAREYVETETRRALMAQVWEETADCLGSEIVLRKPPVSSVVSVKYLNSAGVETTLAVDQYRLVKRPTGEYVVLPAFGVTWPETQDVEAAVTVRFNAGYGTSPGLVPEPIRQAILLLVGHWFANRETGEIPLGVESLIFPFRAF